MLRNGSPIDVAVADCVDVDGWMTLSFAVAVAGQSRNEDISKTGV